MIECFCCGPYATNTYLLVSEHAKQALVIDAAPGSFKALSEKLKNLEVHVFLTHGHWDHVADAGLFKEQLKAKIYFPEADKIWLSEAYQKFVIPPNYEFKTFQPDVYLRGGEAINLLGIDWTVCSTPGHTQGQLALYDKAKRVIFVGDTLFEHGYGRFDLPGGDCEKLMKSLAFLLDLPENVTVYSGHGPNFNIKSASTVLKRHIRF